MRPITLPLLSALVFLVTGCGITNPSPAAPGTTPLSLRGQAMGGGQILGNSIIQLWAANTSVAGAAGYGSVSALQSTVAADANGAFALTGTYTCPVGDPQMYLTATGGNPGPVGTPANVNIGLIAALGKCSTLHPTTHITLNEVTTVAAAYALAQFFGNYSHLGSSSTNAAGLDAAFLMAGNLANYDIGQTYPVVNGIIYPPVAKIYTLANALAACVNSAGGIAGDSSICGNLFTYATGSSVPTNTADAAINIAKAQGSNVTNIYNLVSSSGPFQPTLSTAPNDWALDVFYTINTATIQAVAFDSSNNLYTGDFQNIYQYLVDGTLAGTAQKPAWSIAISPTGDVWTGSFNSIVKYPSGLGTNTSYSFFGTTSGQLNSMAFDTSSNILLTCNACGNIFRISSATGSQTSVILSQTSAFTGNRNIAVAGSGNIWLGNSNLTTISEWDSTGTAISGSPFSCGTCLASGVKNIAADASGNGWFSAGGDAVFRATPTGSVGRTAGFVGGTDVSTAVAVDGRNQVWVANAQSLAGPSSVGAISAFDNTGIAISPSHGYTSANFSSPSGVVTDRAGTVWTWNSGAGNYLLTAYPGLAAPTITPLSQAVVNNTIGTLP